MFSCREGITGRKDGRALDQYVCGCFFFVSLSERIKITPKYDTIVKVWQPHY